MSNSKKVPQWAYSPLLKRKGGEHGDRFRYCSNGMSVYELRNMDKDTLHKARHKHPDIVSIGEFLKRMGW